MWIRRSLGILSLLLSLYSLQARGDDPESRISFKRNLSIVVFSSIGGGVLGLSTLSFYGKPQAHTDNITSGVALGLIGGLAYVLTRQDSPTESKSTDWVPEPNRDFARVQQQQGLYFPISQLALEF